MHSASAYMHTLHTSLSYTFYIIHILSICNQHTERDRQTDSEDKTRLFDLLRGRREGHREREEGERERQIQTETETETDRGRDR